MKVMVVGAGEVGFHIAELLSRERHAVTVIERDPQRAADLRNKLNALVAEGNGASTEALEAAHVSDMELFIAVTDLDEVNLIACLLAHDHGVRRIIARIKSLEYTKAEWTRNAARLGIGMIINPQTVHHDPGRAAGRRARQRAEQAPGRRLPDGFADDHDRLRHGRFRNLAGHAQYILVVLMFVGGCAASTGGSIKVVRILLLSKHAYLQLSRLIHPREVRSLKLDHKPVSREVIQSVLGFFALFIAIFVLGSILLAGILPPAADGTADLVTAGTAVISALGNVGPGLGTVGPTETYTHLPAAGKLVLAVCMLVGRLEVFTVLVLFFPSFWRK